MYPKYTVSLSQLKGGGVFLVLGCVGRYWKMSFEPFPSFRKFKERERERDSGTLGRRHSVTRGGAGSVQ